MPGPDLDCVGYVAQWGFSQHLPAKYTVGKDQKKVLPPERGASDTVSHRKSGPSFCIILIKRLDEGLRKQLLAQKFSISFCLYI